MCIRIAVDTYADDVLRVTPLKSMQFPQFLHANVYENWAQLLLPLMYEYR